MLRVPCGGNPVKPVSRKRLFARCAAVVLTLAFVVGISIGSYYDVGGWLGVAVVWGGTAVAAAWAYALVWAINRWDAQ